MYVHDKILIFISFIPFKFRARTCDNEHHAAIIM